jgi:hypothetical protein
MSGPGGQAADTTPSLARHRAGRLGQLHVADVACNIRVVNVRKCLEMTVRWRGSDYGGSLLENTGRFAQARLHIFPHGIHVVRRYAPAGERISREGPEIMLKNPRRRGRIREGLSRHSVLESDVHVLAGRKGGVFILEVLTHFSLHIRRQVRQGAQQRDQHIRGIMPVV